MLSPLYAVSYQIKLIIQDAYQIFSVPSGQWLSTLAPTTTWGSDSKDRHEGDPINVFGRLLIGGLLLGTRVPDDLRPRRQA
jgi:hypothetical protein